VLIPAVTVPLSLIGSLFLMLLMGFTINLLTLLAMVLAIGIVVDDAIIVLENIHRHIEEGMSPYDAAIKGARELAWPVVAMTTTLVAVYLPIGFQGGLTGVLFTEFAFTLAGSVLLSGVIALTLTPMMSAKILKPHSEGGKGRLEAWLDAKFDALRHGYQRRASGRLRDFDDKRGAGGLHPGARPDQRHPLRIRLLHGHAPRPPSDGDGQLDHPRQPDPQDRGGPRHRRHRRRDDRALYRRLARVRFRDQRLGEDDARDGGQFQPAAERWPDPVPGGWRGSLHVDRRRAGDQRDRHRQMA